MPANDVLQGIPAARLRQQVLKVYAKQIELQSEKRAALKAMDPIDWMQEHFYLPSTEKPIEIFIWQKGILRLALERVDDRFRWSTVLYGTCKKSAKTVAAAAVARWTAETQTRYGSILCCANDFKQAKDRAFKEAKFSIEMTPGYLHGRGVLPGRWDVHQTYMQCHLTGSKIEPIPVDARGEAGGHPSLSVWCVTGDTEVLCRNGWKPAASLTVADEVAALVPETGKMRWEHPRAVNVTPYVGKMVHFASRRAEFTVTPNHRVWGKFMTHSRYGPRERALPWRFEEARDAAKFKGGWLQGHAAWDGETSYDEEKARLMGYYIAEGHINRNSVRFSQSLAVNPATHTAIRECLERAGYVPRYNDNEIRIYDPALAAELRPLGKAHEKFIPEDLKNASPAALRAFFFAYMAGDGTPKRLGWVCTTVSRRLADDLMEVGLKLGYHPRLRCSVMAPTHTMKNGRQIIARYPLHVISFSKGPIYWERSYKGKKTGSWKEIDYDGVVACPSLEHGVFYIRSNGKCVWTGNTELWGMESEEAKRFFAEMTHDPTQPNSVRWVETYAGYDGESELLWNLYQSVVPNGRQITNHEFATRAARDVDGERYEDFLHAFVELAGDPEALVPIYQNDDGGIFAYWDSGPQSHRFPWQDERYYREEEATLPARSFRRLHFNEWVGGEGDFVPVEMWDACYDPELPDLEPDVLNDQGRRVRGPAGVLALDAASTGDCFAAVFVTRHPKDHKVPAVRTVKVWAPEDFPPANRIEFDVVEAWIRDVCAHYNVAQIAYDPYQLEDMMQRLNRERVAWCQEFPQGHDRLESDRGLYGRIMRHDIAIAVNTGTKGLLRQHILNANAKLQKDEDSKMRIIKKAAGRKIDAAVAMSMGVARVMYLNLN